MLSIQVQKQLKKPIRKAPPPDAPTLTEGSNIAKGSHL